MLDDIVLQAFENGVDIDDTAYKLSHEDPPHHADR